jgi:hypothetical protein
MKISPDELLEILDSGKPVKIKVFNLGENLGMDFAYMAHYLVLKKIFPNVTIDLYRSNVDETNCIGFELYDHYAELPVDNMVMEIVRQRYPDGKDWTQKLNSRDYSILSEDFRTLDGYDIMWGIGYGGAPCWMEQYPEDTKIIDSAIATAAIEKAAEQKNITHTFRKLEDITFDDSLIRQWERTNVEYMCYWDDKYPFKFKDGVLDNYAKYKDFIRLGARWPDHVRWYYTVDRQIEVICDIIKKTRELGHSVKVVYTLKDGEVGGNFNRGQTIDKLKRIQDLCDECLFIYSWPANPYHGRKPEHVELAQLAAAGITNVKRVNVWEDLAITSQCKTYLSEPGGFSEVINCMTNDPHNVFVFPVSYELGSTYVTLDKDRQPIRFKMNKIVGKQMYSCKPFLSAPDDPEGYRTTHWHLTYNNVTTKIGDNCHGDDWKYFEQSQEGLFRDWFLATKNDLIEEVVKSYTRG